MNSLLHELPAREAADFGQPTIGDLLSLQPGVVAPEIAIPQSVQPVQDDIGRLAAAEAIGSHIGAGVNPRALTGRLAELALRPKTTGRGWSSYVQARAKPEV